MIRTAIFLAVFGVVGCGSKLPRPAIEPDSESRELAPLPREKLKMPTKPEAAPIAARPDPFADFIERVTIRPAGNGGFLDESAWGKNVRAYRKESVWFINAHASREGSYLFGLAPGSTITDAAGDVWIVESWQQPSPGEHPVRARATTRKND